MLIKKSVYPKTSRVGNEKTTVLTEKVDGSNLVFFKRGGELYVAQRKSIYPLRELEEVKSVAYKGLYQWLVDNGETLEASLVEGSAICGEWIGMGQLKYSDVFENRFLMFAKANIEPEEWKLKNIVYKHDLFIYSFTEQEIPNFISLVPVVKEVVGSVSVAELDVIYAEYEEMVGRMVEGFVLYDYASNSITKYVRRKGKGGTLQDHKS